MRHQGLLELLSDTDAYEKITESIYKGSISAIHGLEGTQKHLFMALLHGSHSSSSTLIICPSEDRAKEVYKDLSILIPDDRVDQFPAREILPLDLYAHSREIIAQRVRVLEKLQNGGGHCIVTTFEALSRRLAPPSLFGELPLSYEQGQSIHREGLVKDLLGVGYERVELVEIPGQFAVRGGLVDIYPITGDNPTRIELFGDEIDTIRYFDPETQLSKGHCSKVSAAPAVEFSLNGGASSKESVTRTLVEGLRKTEKALASGAKKTALSNLRGKIETLLERIEGDFVGDLEAYMPLFVKETYTLLDYFHKKPLVILDEMQHLEQSALEREKEIGEGFEGLLDEGAVLKTQQQIFLRLGLFKETLMKYRRVYFSLLPRKVEGAKEVKGVNVHARTLQNFQRRPKLFIEGIKEWKKAGYRVMIMTSSQERGQNLVESLWDSKIEAVSVSDIDKAPPPGQILVTYGEISGGFEITTEKIVLITDKEIYGGPRDRRLKRRFKEGAHITHISDLKPGDYVVHAQHGIGRYLEIVNLEVQGVKKDYFHIQYQGKDKLYVPTDQVDLVQRYIGSEGRKPRLHKLGGSEWTKVKARVKASVQEVARELLNLYAARETIKGHSFPQDTPWQREFEASFPYKETKDQLQAIEEAKKDMENQRPMDRLLVGDVGYGKTEVALRAAFKAIMDNKQVAVLVPTTILASQHYQTFKGRFDGFPVKIKVLNRLVKTKDQKETIQGLKSGSVDIVIGTHRLLSGDIAFKDLGLLVVDEEQRFGVTHKEKLKRLRQDVDVLTLTATPIPRTLHMALAGARDMSVIDTPPENRYPVQTYVLEHSRELVIEALRRELNRGGQVYYVHNRVNGLERRARDLNDLVPEARVAVGHGQMPAGELEKVMMDFTAGEIDVLVCTTIVENGLDIPNVNTLIVEEAHKFGLSQLYQLRGRVGRTNRIAYAYFTYGRDRILNPTAEKRLNAIVEFTEFGSGFKLAMRDLEIRGAGNLLGQEQHGHMLAVGFDLYCKLLENAVSQLKGEEKEVERKEEIDIDLRVSAYIGDEYIQEPTLKFEIYHRLGGVETMDQLEDLAEELRDRFGKPSQGMKNLLDLTELKILARGLNIKSFKENNGEIKIKFREGAPVNGEAFVILAEAYPRKLSFSSVDGLEITVSKRGAAKDGQIKLLTEILNILLEQSNKK